MKMSILQKRFGVSGAALDWFQSYITDRSQSFRCQEISTDPQNLACGVPQGSVLGPLKFIAYTEDVQTIFRRHLLKYMLFADDKQVYGSDILSKLPSLRATLSACVVDVAEWCAARRLSLNASKTELIWFGSRHNLSKMSNLELYITAGSDKITPTSVVRDLGVMLDSELSMKQHVAKVASLCYYHLRRIRQIRRRVGLEVATQLVVALVLSRLDYCNAVLAGLPASTTEPLQRVQNCAARLLFLLRPRDHVRPYLQRLHWLPVIWRVKYKLCLLMFKSLHGFTPTYIADSLTTCSTKPGRPGLRSQTSRRFVKPMTRTTLGERAFSYAGPAEWNELPPELQSIDKLNDFRRKLKTHLFRAAYPAS